MDDQKITATDHARREAMKLLRNAVQSDFRKGDIDRAKDTIVKMSQSLFSYSKAFQDQYVDTCIERESLLTGEEFVESLHDLT
jgi:hypothetical protein